MGATFGGPILDAGFATIPLPNLLVQGRHGVANLAGRPLDVDYGVNLTAAAFGIAQLHAGASWLALDQGGWVPALSITERLYLLDNHLDTSKVAEIRSTHLVNQLELTASWDTNPALLYLGAAEYLDVREPALLLTPFVGAEFHLGEHWGLQLEARHYAINTRNVQNSFNWVTWGPGAIGANLGVTRRFGASKENP